MYLIPEGQEPQAGLLPLLDSLGYRVRITTQPAGIVAGETELALVQLPSRHTDAVTLLRVWREALPPGQPILALGAWTDPEQVEPLLRGGATDYLASPWQTRELAVRLLVLRRSTKRLTQELQQRVAETQRLETLAALSGSLAHDFNNLLAAILGNAEVAMLDSSLSGSTRYSLEQIDRASRHAAELTRQMVTYSGRPEPGFQPVSLAELVEDMAEILRASISRLSQVEFDFEPNLPAVLGEPSQLRQVVMNLLVNASEAMTPHGGVILVSARTQRRGDPARVILEVADSGAGIPPEYQQRIFDPFFSTKRSGRGLGLAAVRSIVNSHGGAVEVESEPGRGSTFRLDFPALVGVEARRSGVTELPRGRGTGLVLLIEDEAPVREAAAHLLARSGFTVLEAADGQEGASLFKRHAAALQAVILDLGLSGLAGEDLLRLIRQRRSDLCVVIWSGFDRSEIEARTRGMAVTAIIEKPGHVRELAAVLCRSLDGLSNAVA
jgi:two-component system, cell cycle sensor histidine kinase and response regulator CckA